MNTSDKILKQIDIAISKYENFRKSKKVGIQLPDGLKYWAYLITEHLENKGFEVLISASHCYGACDIDTNVLKEVDILLHFAHHPVVDIPNVLYIPYEIDYNPNIILEFSDLIEEKKISLIATAQYLHKIHEVKKILEEDGFKVYLIEGGRKTKLPGYVLGCNYSSISENADAVVFIGDGEFHPKGAAVYSNKKVYAISPLTKDFKIFDEKDIKKFIINRYSKILKCIDLSRFCVFVSSKPGQKRLKLAKNIKMELKNLNKECLLIYCDEIDFKNFVCDCYINTACPRISYDDFIDDVNKPILTPQEVEIILNKRSWEDYKIDIMH